MKKRYIFLLIAICCGAYWCAANFVLFADEKVFVSQKSWENKLYSENAFGPKGDVIAWVEKNKPTRIRPHYIEPANIQTYRLRTFADAGLFPCKEWHVNLEIDLNDIKNAKVYAASECSDPNQ